MLPVIISKGFFDRTCKILYENLKKQLIIAKKNLEKEQNWRNTLLVFKAYIKTIKIMMV